MPNIKLGELYRIHNCDPIRFTEGSIVRVTSVYPTGYYCLCALVLGATTWQVKHIIKHNTGAIRVHVNSLRPLTTTNQET